MIFNPGWYLLYTKARHEKKVTREMDKRMISFFFPTTKVMRVWHDRKKIMEMPLFPSYIFVYLNSMADYFEAKKPDGVLNYVHFSNEVARVNNEVVENLKFVMERGASVEVSTARFMPGQQAYINHGVFSGLSCEVVKHKNELKVLVRINILNRVVLADVAAAGLTVH